MSRFDPMTIVLPPGRWELIQAAMNAPPKEAVPFAPPDGLLTSLDLYEAWRRHEGDVGDDVTWARSTELKGLPLTEHVIASFPAFAEMGGDGFYNALHVTMDDGNLDDDNVARAVELAAQEGDIAAHRLALDLQSMSEDERIALYCSFYPWGETEF